MSEPEPNFGSDAEAAAYWRARYTETKEELEEYKDTSAEYERELERELGKATFELFRLLFFPTQELCTTGGRKMYRR